MERIELVSAIWKHRCELCRRYIKPGMKFVRIHDAKKFTTVRYHMTCEPKGEKNAIS